MNAGSTAFAANNSHWDVTADCRAGCLYDLRADPGEHEDVSASHPDVVDQLRARLEQHNATVRGLGHRSFGWSIRSLVRMPS